MVERISAELGLVDNIVAPGLVETGILCSEQASYLTGQRIVIDGGAGSARTR